MKEFIEKLIGRLEEITELIRPVGWSKKIEVVKTKAVIEIVNQLAEEYNNESVKGDLISRSTLLEEIKSLRVTIMGLRAGKGILAEYANQYKDTLLRVIEEQPTAYNNGWIPCSQQMPPPPKINPAFQNKPLELYLVSEENADYPYRVFWNGKFFTDGWSKVDAVAWQPLPPVYQSKGE